MKRFRALAELVIVGALDRLDRQIDDRLGGVDALEREVGALGAVGIAGGALDPHHGDDIAGRGRVDVFLLVGVDPQNSADPGALPLPGVVVEASLGERSLVDPHERHLAERLFDQLEGHGDERRIGVGGQGQLGPLIAVVLGVDLAVERAGQIAVDGVEQRLNSLVAIRRADHHGADLLGDRALADRLVDQIERNLGLFEQELHDLVGEHRERFEHSLSGSLGGSGHVGRDRLAAHVFAVFAVKVDRHAVDQVDHALKARLGADRQLERNRRQAELALELLDHVGGVGTGSVHLVDERDARNRVALHLAIDRDRLRLNARHGAEHEHRAVEHAQRPLDFDGEINVPRRVDDVDLRIIPADGRRGRGDRDPSLALELHVVHHRAFTLHLLDDVGAAGVIQDPLGQRRLARVDVR